MRANGGAAPPVQPVAPIAAETAAAAGSGRPRTTWTFAGMSPNASCSRFAAQPVT